MLIVLLIRDQIILGKLAFVHTGTMCKVKYYNSNSIEIINKIVNIGSYKSMYTLRKIIIKYLHINTWGVILC